MLIVTNRIKVDEDSGSRFEQRAHGGRQEEVPGRVFFARLKADDPGVYINMSAWESREAFETWRGSENFKQVHSGRTTGMATGPTRLTIAEVVYSEGSLMPDRV